MNYCRFLPILILFALAACQPKAPPVASLPEDHSPAIATINGMAISRDFFESYIKAITGKASSELTPEQRNGALDNLIRAELLGQQATKEGVDRNPDTSALLQLTRLNVLQQAMSDRYLKDRKPTEQELRAEYETQLTSLSKQEYHARHILVATEPFAQKVIARLEKGEKFEELARRESMDSSKESGGDLGWFTPDRMVKPFADAVAAMKPGEYTHKAVQTQFGWHVIQLLETRELSPPPYDKVRQRLEQVVQAKKFKAYTDDLMRSAKIEKNLGDAPPASSSGTATPPASGTGAPASGAAAPASGGTSSSSGTTGNASPAAPAASPPSGGAPVPPGKGPAQPPPKPQ